MSDQNQEALRGKLTEEQFDEFNENLNIDTPSELVQEVQRYLLELNAAGHIDVNTALAFNNFMNGCQHLDGNACQAIISSQIFEPHSMGELCDSGLITMWHYTNSDMTGDFVIYSDQERMLKFDMGALLQLFAISAIRNDPHPFWNAI